MKNLLFIFLTLFGCSDSTLMKHTVEEKYIYPSYYDVYIEDSDIEFDDTAGEEFLPVWVDSFVQPSASEGVDILWVIDPSGSMISHKARVLAGIEDMMNALPLNISWRLGIISADMNHSVNDPTFPLLPGDTVSDAQAVYQNSVTGGYESGFRSVYRYIEQNPFAANWMREDAALLIVFVSDEEEQGTSRFPLVSDFTDWLDEQRNGIFVASIVNHDPSISDCNYNSMHNGVRYMDAAQYYNGQIIDICSNDWSSGVIDATNQIQPYTTYELTHDPIDPAEIYVFVDGVIFTYWAYDLANNEIVFNVIPSEGSLVEIGYNYDPNN